MCFDIFRKLPPGFMDVTVNTMIKFLKSFDSSNLREATSKSSAVEKELFLVRT